ncbi:MAG: hypothetical protein CIT01_09100 [Methanobacterium sp. BRmetb2]|nr:MAG: hypothetical protein CIT01_09100 [Methanobacterium sp. BRmetb2]
MKIDSITIKNVKSFRDEVIIDFNNDYNILVGPNGGGKSNLLDIITVILRHFIIKGYKITSRTDKGREYKDISEYNLFGQINNILDKFIGNNSDSCVKIDLEVNDGDIENINIIKNNLKKFEEIWNKYRTKPIFDFEGFKSLDLTILKSKQILTYEIKNNSLSPPSNNKPEYIYLQYLNFFNLFVLLAKEMTEIDKLNNIYLYFSPYRVEEQQNLQVSLASENYYGLLEKDLRSTSKTISSSLKLATFHFAEKMRFYEADEDEKHLEKWKKDSEVKLVDHYLEKLGYSWEIDLIDPNRNLYEIILTKDGKKFNIGQASSGEKEIINFLLGIFAFNIENGLVIIDEPELHLHPKWQSLLMDLFIDLSEKTGNQFILSTHSPVFINNKTISNITRIYMDKRESNKVKLDESKLKNVKDLLHMINSHNNEKMFFADKVVLVEGIHDRLIFEKLIKLFSEDISEVIDVLEVGGKHNLEKYRKFLDNIKVKNFIIADFDYLLDIGAEEIKDLFKTSPKQINKEVINKKSSKDGKRLVEELENAIDENDIAKLKEVWEYIKYRHRKIKDVLTDDEKKLVNNFIDSKMAENIFILKEGELEDYLPDGYKSKDLEKIIELSKDENFFKWWNEIKNDEKGIEMSSIISFIVNA